MNYGAVHPSLILECITSDCNSRSGWHVLAVTVGGGSRMGKELITVVAFECFVSALLDASGRNSSNLLSACAPLFFSFFFV